MDSFNQFMNGPIQKSVALASIESSPVDQIFDNSDKTKELEVEFVEVQFEEVCAPQITKKLDDKIRIIDDKLNIIENIDNNQFVLFSLIKLNLKSYDEYISGISKNIVDIIER